ncbi:hypothetical protein [Streptomyces sp. NRRL S-15]|uniref:hypothetical protein n=1 Tax=Streptomyces sp. NRRL S-15 TaxID=1463886 RepID=UPI0004CC2E97|nr:hypothetical protein [Streptomyces sp. NRRL S-15]
MATFTRTHVHTTFAHPHLVCALCRQPATGFHHGDDTACGCETGDWLIPCKHPAEAVDTCWSWDPVDGCQCPGGPASHADREPTR